MCLDIAGKGNTSLRNCHRKGVPGSSNPQKTETPPCREIFRHFVERYSECRAGAGPLERGRVFASAMVVKFGYAARFSWSFVCSVRVRTTWDRQAGLAQGWKPPQNACPVGGQGQTITASEFYRKSILCERPSVKKPFQKDVEKEVFYIVRFLPGPWARHDPVAPGGRAAPDSGGGNGRIPARSEREGPRDI